MLSFLVSTLVAVAAVSAQSTTTSSANPACTSATFNINSQSDLNTLTACTNVEGDVIISPSIATVNLGGITTINGNLEIINNGSSSTPVAITTVTGASLQSIAGVFTLTQLTQLNAMTLPSLTSVGGIDFTTLPVLRSLGFGGVTTASSVTIADTLLDNLNGISLSRADVISITNNQYITTFSMPSLTEVGTSLLISDNAAGLSLSLPLMTNCGNFTAQQVGNLSINALANVTGSLGLTSNTFALVQANNLTRITGDLFINNNTQLMNISMPSLQTVQGFQIANNTQLATITYPALTTVGAVDLTGTFSSVSLPALTRVNGGLNIQSSSSSFTCPVQQSIVRSTSFVCKSVAVPKTATTTTAGSSGGSATSTATTSGSSSTSSAKSSATTTQSMGFMGSLLLLIATLL